MNCFILFTRYYEDVQIEEDALGGPSIYTVIVSS
jgi:hypothetical protein